MYGAFFYVKIKAVQKEKSNLAIKFAGICCLCSVRKCIFKNNRKYVMCILAGGTGAIFSRKFVMRARSGA